MPLYKTISPNATTKILVWKVTETFADLISSVVLSDKTKERLERMKSESHQRAFLSVRRLFQEIGHTDFDLYYDVLGKPHIVGEKHISITHSHHFTAIIISTMPVGIDIEMQREKIIKIATKFCSVEEMGVLCENNKLDFVKNATIFWGAKEAIFKIISEKGISFKNNIFIQPSKRTNKEGFATVHSISGVQEFHFYTEDFEGFTLVYAFKSILS